MYAQNAVKVLNMANLRVSNYLNKMSHRCDIARSQLRRKSYSAESTVFRDKLEPVSELSLPFARAKVGSFFQAQPELGNQFLEDVTLQKYLRRHMPNEIIGDIFQDLEHFGERVGGSVNKLGRECELNPPRLEQYDAWGKRVDRLITCPAWKELKAISAEEGLIATAYERKYGEWSRLYQLAKLYLFAPSSGVFGCPLAMADGAVKSIEVIGKDGLLSKAYSRLTCRDPKLFWTSGQWMTERKGGSDVAGGTQTIAVKQADGSYKLYGYKWFSSATDADMSLTLARVCNEHGQYLEGTKGLSMFYLEVRDANGNLNNIEVQRLKDKLGTRTLPTAELLLDGTKAYMVSEEGRGVASIANMLTLTRMHNTLTSAASMRRIVNLARDYSRKRECFGKIISNHAIHMKTLASMEVEARAATLLSLELGRLLGLDDCDKMKQSDSELFRLLTPLAKLYTAKQAVAVVSEGLECFGGMGYLEDTGLPVILRDTQVLPIWEGTTNVLSLDVLRAVYKSQGSVLKSFATEVLRRLELVRASGSTELHASAENVKLSLQQTMEFAQKNASKLEVAARDFAFSLARTYMGMLMLEHAAGDSANMDILAANRWCQKDLCTVLLGQKCADYEESTTAVETELVYAGYEPIGRS